MGKIIGKKDPGLIENILAVFAGIFAMSALFFLLLTVIGGIQMKNQIDQTARRAVLIAESYGYVDSFSKSDLIRQLKEAGVAGGDIRTMGYNREGKWTEVSEQDPASYGRKIQVEITGTVRIRSVKTDVHVVRVSTSKN